MPKPLEQLILRCLEKKPDARFNSGQELRDAFQALEQRATASRIAIPRVALIAALAVLVVGVAIFAWRSYQTASRVRWVETTVCQKSPACFRPIAPSKRDGCTGRRRSCRRIRARCSCSPKGLLRIRCDSIPIRQARRSMRPITPPLLATTCRCGKRSVRLPLH